MNESQTEFPAIVRGCPAGFRPVPAPRAPKPEPYLFREIGLRVVQEVERAEPLPVINSPADLHALVERMRAFLFPNPDVEQFVAVAVNTKNRVIGWHTVSVGTLNSTNALPREVFRFAVLAAAKAIAVVHNHPTGDPAPSPADLIVTRNLRAAGETLGINLFEHLILGTRVDDPLGVGYYSFSRTGVL